MNLFALMLASEQTIFAKTTHKESQISKKSSAFDELLQLFERQGSQGKPTFHTQKEAFLQRTSKYLPNRLHNAFKNEFSLNSKHSNPYKHKDEKSNDNLQLFKVKEDRVTFTKRNAKRVLDHHTPKRSQFLGSIKKSTDSFLSHRPNLKNESLLQAKDSTDFFKMPMKKVDASKTTQHFIDQNLIESIKTSNYSINDGLKDDKNKKIPKNVATHIKEAHNPSNSTRRTLSKTNKKTPLLQREGGISKQRQIGLFMDRKELRAKEGLSLDSEVAKNKKVKEVETKPESLSKQLAQTESFANVDATVESKPAKSVIESMDIKKEDRKKIVDSKTMDRHDLNRSVKIVKEEFDSRQNFDVQKQPIQNTQSKEPLSVDRSHHISTSVQYLHLDIKQSVKANRPKNDKITKIAKIEDFIDEQHPIFVNHEDRTHRIESVSPAIKARQLTEVEIDHQKQMESEYLQDEVANEELVGTPQEYHNFQEFENRLQEQHRRHYKLNLGDTKINISYNKSQLHLQFVTNSNYFLMDGMEHYIEHVMSEHSFDDYEVKLKDKEKSLIVRSKKDGTSSVGSRSMIDVKA